MTTDFPRQFAAVLASLDKHNLARLEDIYHPELHFTGPLRELQGVEAMREHLSGLFARITYIGFEFHQCQDIGEDQALLRWTLTYSNPRLKRGLPIEVSGCSYLRHRNGRAYRQIDYYDTGALLYEHVPLLGQMIAWIKTRLL